MKFSCPGRSADVFLSIYVQNDGVTYKLIDATYLPIWKHTYHPLTISESLMDIVFFIDDLLSYGKLLLYASVFISYTISFHEKINYSF